MSLINKMLQDLDRRHAMAAPESPPPRQVHAVEGSGRREWFWRIVAALLLVAVGWTAWVAWQLRPRTVVTDLAYMAGKEARARAAVAKSPVVAQVAPPRPTEAPPQAAVAPPKPAAAPPQAAVAPPKPAAAPPQAAIAPPKPAAGSPQTTAAPTKPAVAPTKPAAASPQTSAAPPKPAVAPPQAAAVPPAPAASVETFKLALKIETPVGARAPTPTAKAKEFSDAGKLKPAAESAAAPASKAAPKASPKTSPAEDKKAIAALTREVAQAPVLPTPPTAGARVEKRDRTRSSAERAEAEFRRAVGLLNQGRASEAEEGLAAALEKDPAHEAARQALVALQIERRQLDHARRLLQEGLAINPAQTAFAIALARIFVERRDYHAALETLQAGAGTSRNNPEFESMRGTVLQRLGRHREAADAYQSALRAQAGNPHAWIGLGISLEALAQRAEAADAFRRSLASGPLSAELKNFAEQRIRALQ